MVPNNHPVNGRSLVAVTGATGGLGKSFAVECASRGYNLFLTDLHIDTLDTLADSLRRTYGVEVVTCACDLTDIESRSALFNSIQALTLRFWALVNVAGIDYEGLFIDTTPEQIRTIIRLNIESTLELTHFLMQHRDTLCTFRILNVASLAAFSPMPVKAVYAASKRFLLDFSLALREEIREWDATVTILCPAGMPNTPENIQAIEAQGLLGQITTLDAGRVACQALDSCLAGKAVVIPGLANRALTFLGGLVPVQAAVRLLGNRWKSARQKRGLFQPVHQNS